MTKRNKQRRALIAFVFYLIAMGLVIVECIIANYPITFPIVIGTPISYPIYYMLLSKYIEECKVWPLAAILGICVILMVGSKNEVLIFEVLEIILFVIEVITAFVVCFKYPDDKKNKIR